MAIGVIITVARSGMLVSWMLDYTGLCFECQHIHYTSEFKRVWVNTLKNYLILSNFVGRFCAEGLSQNFADIQYLGDSMCYFTCIIFQMKSENSSVLTCTSYISLSCCYFILFLNK